MGVATMWLVTRIEFDSTDSSLTTALCRVVEGVAFTWEEATAFVKAERTKVTTRKELDGKDYPHWAIKETVVIGSRS